MISVIVPIYKSELTLLRTLNSINDVRVSSGYGLEAILVFDGPDENCELIVSNWQKTASCKIFVVHQKHEGVAAARNNGIIHASNDLITFLDSDDELLSPRFENLSEIHQNEIVIGKQRIIFENNFEQHKRNKIVISAPSEHHILTMVINRQTFSSMGGFNPEFSHGSDWDFIIRAKASGLLIRYSNDYYVSRYLHDENESLNFNALRRQQLLALRNHIKSK